jgi:O-antigen/teichoic acid export membrane protein
VRSRLRSILSRDFVRVSAHTYALAGLTLVFNLLGGVIVARGLGPGGRGEAVALAMLVQNVGFVFAVGCVQAVSFRYAREPKVAGRLLTTWVVMLLPLAVLGTGLGELLLPVLFSAQSSAAVDLGRIYLLTVALVLWGELVNGLLLGARDYLWANVVRFAQPALTAVAVFVLWRLDVLTVARALWVGAGSAVVVQAVAMARAVRNAGGFGRLDTRLGLDTLWYGFRGHGALLANAMNQRLDLLIMPAFIAAAGLGLYSIAANVSLIVSTLANSLAAVVLPAAAHDPARGSRTVIGSLQLGLGVAAAFAAVLLALARPALELVYGTSFGHAAPALRVLLPGTVLLAGALILVAGLYALDRPTTATAVQVSGLVVTVVGLLVFLPSGDIMTAAIVSTVSYAVVFAGALLAYKRAAAIRWRAFFAPPAALRAERSAA